MPGVASSVDVVTAEQAKIAEEATVVAAAAPNHAPADIWALGGGGAHVRPDPSTISSAAVSIPVMAKARIGATSWKPGAAGAQGGLHRRIRSALTRRLRQPHQQAPTSRCSRVWRDQPWRGTAAHRRRRCHDSPKGEAGTGDVSEATKHIRTINKEIAALASLTDDELFVAAKELAAPYDLLSR